MRLAMPIYGKNARRELTAEFHGYNCTDMGGDGNGESTFLDMLNGGTDKYPFAASRLPRSVTQYNEATCALSGGDVLIRVQPPYLIYNDRQYDLGLTVGDKQIVRMGTNLLVFPDGKYFNISNGESGDIDEGEVYDGDIAIRDIICSEGKRVRFYNSSLSMDTIDVSFKRSDGENDVAKVNMYNYKSAFYTEKLDTIPTFENNNITLCYSDGKFYYVQACDFCENPDLPNYYLASNIVWEELTVEGFFFGRSTEYVDLFSITALWNGNQHAKVEYLDNEDTQFNTTTDGAYLHMMPGQVPGDVADNIRYKNDELSLFYKWKRRLLPIFDHVIVCNNRLFGCRHGIPYDGSEPVSKIYASAFNDFKAFEQFKAISTDSWWGDVSEEGPFTGAWVKDGYPMFFKEDYLYILNGDYPPYTYTIIQLRGVAIGAAKSLAEVNGALFYKSRHDIMRYTSSSLSSISQALGNISDITHAVGGTYRDNYYISLDGVMFVYDTAKGIWAKEDDLPVIDFANVRGEMYFLGKGGTVYKVNDGEEHMPWSFTSPPIGYAYPNRKRVSSIRVRIEIGEGDELPLVELSLDGGDFRECITRVNFLDIEGKRTGSILIPILPKRCELFQYRISGNGTYKLTGITKTIKESGR